MENLTQPICSFPNRQKNERNSPKGMLPVIELQRNRGNALIISCHRMPMSEPQHQQNLLAQILINNHVDLTQMYTKMTIAT